MQAARLHSQLNAETVGAKNAHLHVRYESRSEEDHRAVGPTMGASTELQFLVKMKVFRCKKAHLQKFYPIIESTYLSVKPIPTAAVAQITINRRPIMMLSRLLGTLLLMSDRTF